MHATNGAFGTALFEELSDLDGDPRLRRRAERMLARWQEKPGFGFPEMFEESSELEAAYRFFGNPSISFDRLGESHFAKTAERVALHEGTVLAIHDTTAFVFSGDREGLGFINKNNRGFLAHLTLVATRADGDEVLPLGVANARTWIREQKRSDKGVAQHELRTDPTCESHRWLDAALDTAQRLGMPDRVVHVMDREGDIYDCLSTMVAKSVRFVVRASKNRVVEPEDSEFHLLFDALDGLPIRYRDEVSVSKRKSSKLPDQKRLYPARDGRLASICVTATTVRVKRTRNSSKDYPAETQLGVVHVFEPEPPTGETPLEWILLTNQPLETDEQLREVVACYRQRWLIEELFMAIKTGCVFEKRQLSNYHALKNALAMTLPVAWNLLLLRTQSRTDSSLPANAFVPSSRLEILRAHAVRYKLPENPTLKDVAYAIAGMGGHLKRNGPPGWRTLRRGFTRLLTLEEGWTKARATCDQS